MRSIRTRFTILTTFAIMISVLATVMIVSFSVSKYINNMADDLLRLVCAARQEALDNYFNSIQQSVNTIANYAAEDLADDDADIDDHIRAVDRLFRTVAKNTNGTLTYYYRVAPEIAGDGKGFWYQRGSDNAFAGTEVTEIEKYDPDDISHVGWYYIPKETGKPVWLDPYFNDNMGVRMISYVVPVYREGKFFGVIGMDFSYEDLVAHVEVIDEFEHGDAFLTDPEGNIVFHRNIEPGTSLEDADPEGLLSTGTERGNSVIRYRYEGQNKRAASTVLANNMRLYVTAPESEIVSGLRHMIARLIASALAILGVFALFTSMAARRITLPLSNLTKAATAFDNGDFNVEVEYDGKDEIGILTNSFNQMREHLRSQIGSLNDMAFKDTLTGIRNKSSFDIYAGRVDEMIASSGVDEPAEFAVCMFDCNDLKEINDTFGHDKGDLYLRASCRLICDVFRHSAVFRIGGDEFIAILQNADYENREDVCRIFDEKVSQSLASGKDPWEQTGIAKGLAEYDPSSDTCIADVVKRADELMYAAKERMKKARDQYKKSAIER